MWLFFGYLSKKRSLSTSLTPRNIGIYDCYLRHLLSQASAAFGAALASDKVERGDACLRLISVIICESLVKVKKKFRVPYKYTKLLLQKLVIRFLRRKGHFSPPHDSSWGKDSCPFCPRQGLLCFCFHCSVCLHY